MRKERAVFDLIPEELRRAVDSCWIDPVNESVWIILLPGWEGKNGRCMHMTDLSEVTGRTAEIHEKHV